MSKQMDKKNALEMYKTMIKIRKFEERLYYVFLTQPMPGSMHQYNGEEAVAVGVCAHLDKEDYITSTHRGHGHCIAKRMDISAIMAEIYAKKDGCCKGMGGSMHLTDIKNGVIGTNGIVGGGIPLAVGAALNIQYKKKKNVSVAFFGDGASNEGIFHESLNLASVWKLPIVFVCENNLYGSSTHYKRVTGVEDIAKRASGYGIQGVTLDGMNLAEVFEESGKAIERARIGEGPTLLECKTYRYMGHSRFENSNYRTKEEIEEWKTKDPIVMFRKVMLDKFGLKQTEIEKIEAEVEDEINHAVEFAEQSPYTEPEDYKNYLYA